MIITIGGPPGSGKSTAAERLSRRLGVRLVCAGQMFREMARERNLSLAEFGRLAEKEWDIDRELDKRVLAEAQGDVIVEGRLSGPLLALKGIDAFRVYLDAEPEIRAARTADRERKHLPEALKEIQERERSETQRYRDIYGVDIWDTTMYDLVIDSSAMTPDEVLDRIVQGLDRH